MTKVITWNGIPSSSIPELVVGPVNSQLIGKPRGSQIEVPGRDGSWFFGDSRGRRTLTAECFVLADTFQGRRDAVEAVAEWFDVETQAYLVISDRVGVYYEAIITEAPDVDEWRQLGKFELAWEINPYALADEITVESFVTTVADFTHNWDAGLDTNVFPVIEVRPNNGTIDGFTLQVNSQDLYYAGPVIADDQTVAVNSIAAIVTSGLSTDTDLTGAYNPATVIMQSVAGYFPILIPPSTNSVRFLRGTGTATNVTVTISYRKRFRR